LALRRSAFGVQLAESHPVEPSPICHEAAAFTSKSLLIKGFDSGTQDDLRTYL